MTARRLWLDRQLEQLLTTRADINSDSLSHAVLRVCAVNANLQVLLTVVAQENFQEIRLIGEDSAHGQLGPHQADIRQVRFIARDAIEKNIVSRSDFVGRQRGVFPFRLL